MAIIMDAKLIDLQATLHVSQCLNHRENEGIRALVERQPFGFEKQSTVIEHVGDLSD